MAIPKILDDLLDYDDLSRRIQSCDGTAPTYIWCQKGRVEEAWAACSLLGLIVDDNVAPPDLNGVPTKVDSAYIFMPAEAGKFRWPHPLARGGGYVSPTHGHLMMVGAGGRFNLTDLHTYFKYWETNHVPTEFNGAQH